MNKALVCIYIRLVRGALWAVALLAFTHSLSPFAIAQNEPSRQPILRIETGMHNDTISSMDVDASGRYLVTLSTDRIVRVWELPSGRLLRVIRAFIPDTPGKGPHKVSISPDGLAIAAVMPDNDGNTSLYFFNRDSGRLIRRLPQPNIGVYKLTFSKDNHHLAEGFNTIEAGRRLIGVRVFDLQSYTLVGEDTFESTGHLNDVTFDHTNKLVTSFSDRLRLCSLEAGGKLKLLVEKPMEDRALGTVEFSPDNSRIAVISYGKSHRLDYRVLVLSARDLTEAYTPTTTGMSAGSGIVWSYDGKTLYARFSKVPNNFIRAWDEGGRGEYRDIAIRNGYITELKALRDGGFVYSSDFFGIVGADGEEKLLVTRNAVEFGSLCPPTSEAIRFNFMGDFRTYAQFSASSLNLELPLVSPVGVGCIAFGIRKAEQVPENLRRVFNKIHDPKAGGDYAITPDHQGIIQSTVFWGLRLYGQDETLRWQIISSSLIRHVAVSADGGYVIALHSDGAIRWRRMADGQHLLTFFLHNDKKRWVVWTPSGYYAASPGAEDLIGWHVNNGKDQSADFFPVGQLRSTYYRPDVVSKVLARGDEQLALRQANEEAGRKQQQADVAKMLPPVVEIASPADNSEVSA